MLFVVGYTYAFRCGCLSGFLQQQLVYFDPDTAYALFFGSANHYPAIATGQVIDHVSFFYIGEFEHSGLVRPEHGPNCTS